jgi:voltage-gated potassium channel Kch
MTNGGETSELRTSSYELFIGALSILSILNLVLLFTVGEQEQTVVWIIDGALTLVFLIDFGIRLTTAPSKSGYFFRGGGWLDLVGSLPLLRIFRLFRVLRVSRLLRRYGFRNIVRDFLRNPAQGGLLLVALLAVMTLEFGGIFVLHAELKSPDANIKTGGEAIWWACTTITTVGYGDFYPVTKGGRIVGVITMVVGIGLFGTFTGYLANLFLGPRQPAASAAEPSSPAQQIESIRRQLDENAQASAALRERLSQIAATL